MKASNLYVLVYKSCYFSKRTAICKISIRNLRIIILIELREQNYVIKTPDRCDKVGLDCIDGIGNAKYVTKFDLLKGFWQVPLTERAKEISAFATPNGL